MSANILLHRSNERISQSSCSKYLATVGVDETVRIWQITNGKLLHELQPPKQLTTPISTIAFSPKEFSLDGQKGGEENSLLVLGTIDGRVMLYDWTLRKILKQNKVTAEGNTSVISILWENNQTVALLLSTSVIYFWDVVSNNFSQTIKVKGNRSMCKLDSGQYAVASQSIEISARNSADVPQPSKFTGHASPVNFLLYVKADRGHFILSASVNDTFVYMWKASNEGDQSKVTESLVTRPYLTLKIGEGVTSVVCSERIIATVSVSGILRLFYVNYHRGSPQGPILPSASLTLAPSDDEDKAATPVVQVTSLTDSDVVIAYGMGAALHFETISLSSLVGDTTLIRNTKISTGGVGKKLPLVSTKTNENTTYANPLSVPEIKNKKLHGKRGRDEEEPVSSLPISILLKSLSTNEGTDAAMPSFDSKCQTHLLLQALHSDNKEMVTKVLWSKDPVVIRSTLAKLPVTAVIPLLQYFNKHCLPVWHLHYSYTLWMKELLLQHNAYISSLPQCTTLFTPFIKYADVRTASISKLFALNTRLEMIKVQIEKTNVFNIQSEKMYTPLITFVDTSEEEGDEEESDEEMIVNGPNAVNGLISSEEDCTDSEESMQVDNSDEEVE